MNEKKSVEINIAGHKLPIRTDGDPTEVEAAAELVREKIELISSNKSMINTQSLLLVAMNLAHELQRERKEHSAFKSDIRLRSEAMIEKLDAQFGLDA